MIKKYKLTEESVFKSNFKLFKIEALIEFETTTGIIVKVGEKGGFVQSESNLSQDGSSCPVVAFLTCKRVVSSNLKQVAKTGVKMTELQLYKYIRDVLNAAEDELNWNGDELTLQMRAGELDDFMEFIEESESEQPMEISYYHGKIQIDLVPICELYEIEPENILAME